MEMQPLLDKYQAQPNALIQILLEIQHERCWLSREMLVELSERLNIPLNRIYHIATFHKAMSLVPTARHIISVCMGTSCYVRGAPIVLEEVQKLTGLKPEETDSEFRFSLETFNCPGTCPVGPVMIIDGNHYTNVQVSRIEGILANYR